MEDRSPCFLPADVVAMVLRHLPPRDLAVSRSVCKAWRAVVDERGMLRSDLLPLTLGGIFLNLGYEPAPPLLFSPPTMGPSRIGGKLESFVNIKNYFGLLDILGSSNGLLFFGDQVANPATRQWEPVPPCPIDPEVYNRQGEVYFAFEPWVSPHYEVLYTRGPYDDGVSEWPPLTCSMCVYSSGTGRWEEQQFVREGDPAGTVEEEERADSYPEDRKAVYWHGSLYVHCKKDFIMRITISNRKYQVIKLPAGVSAWEHNLHLVKSKLGVYFAVVGAHCQLRVWLLKELGGSRAEWVLRHDMNLEFLPARFSIQHRDDPIDKPWILHHYCSRRAATQQVDSEWDSDNDNVIQIDTDAVCDFGRYMCLFGFHPYKEMVFLYLGHRVVTCHLDTLKVQDLGPLKLPYYGEVIDATYVYTPCWTTELAKRN